MCSVASHYCRVSFTVIFTCTLFFVVVERIFEVFGIRCILNFVCISVLRMSSMHSNIQYFLLWYTSALFTNFDSFVIHISMYQVWCVPFAELHKHASDHYYLLTLKHFPCGLIYTTAECLSTSHH